MSAWGVPAVLVFVFMVATTIIDQRQNRLIAALVARIAQLEYQRSGQCFAVSPGGLGFGQVGICSLPFGHRGAHSDGNWRHWSNLGPQCTSHERYEENCSACRLARVGLPTRFTREA